MGDCLGTPGTSGMGSNIEVTNRQEDDLSSRSLVIAQSRYPSLYTANTREDTTVNKCQFPPSSSIAIILVCLQEKTIYILKCTRNNFEYLFCSTSLATSQY